jgi:hypothetical protein
MFQVPGPLGFAFDWQIKKTVKLRPRPGDLLWTP